ncbi:MAG: phosphatidylglycerophosphatase A [Candidatus Krumholzibacteriota bacterium]|nr:phosphatidylglycerophosphatase A [Candidatus Krumholzibacteriota bacterium]
MKKFVVTILGSFFYTGFFPFASATFACAVWIAVWLFVPGAKYFTHPVVVVLAIPVAIYLANVMEDYYGHDASEIVVDEFIGMQITLFMIQPAWKVGIAAFILFRIFDIIKPFPAGRAERLKGGLGVVADDALAGVYSFIALFILMRFFDLT